MGTFKIILVIAAVVTVYIFWKKSVSYRQQRDLLQNEKAGIKISGMPPVSFASIPCKDGYIKNPAGTCVTVAGYLGF